MILLKYDVNMIYLPIIISFKLLLHIDTYRNSLSFYLLRKDDPIKFIGTQQHNQT